MKMNSTEMNEMTRILSGDASKEEQAHFYRSLEDNPDKKNKFEVLEREWITANDAMLFKNIDINGAWERQKEEFLGINTSSGNLYKNVWKWAAIIILAVGLAFYFSLQRLLPSESTIAYQTNVGEVLPLTLEDGSLITLNESTSLSYAFTPENRTVSFSGEAIFKIASDRERPFIIETESAYVKVVGTEFNVKTSGSAVDVTVTEGLVEFGTKDRKDKLMMRAGSSASIHNNQIIQNEIAKPNVNSWFTKQLVFNHAPLSEVLSDISTTYHIDFSYKSDAVNDCHLTADFSNEDLDNVLETIQTIFNVEIKKHNKTYIVTGQPCK